jgi:hypothetical protein
MSGPQTHSSTAATHTPHSFPDSGQLQGVQPKNIQRGDNYWSFILQAELTKSANTAFHRHLTPSQHRFRLQADRPPCLTLHPLPHPQSASVSALEQVASSPGSSWPPWPLSRSPSWSSLVWHLSCISIIGLVTYYPSASSATAWILSKSCCSFSSFRSMESLSKHFLTRKEMTRLISSPRIVDMADSILDYSLGHSSGGRGTQSMDVGGLSSLFLHLLN